MGVIKTVGLTKRFGGKLAVEGLSFEIAKGELFGLLGPNGAGKTTTVRLLAALIGATEGEPAGRRPCAPTAPGARPHRLATSSPGLYERLSALKNLEFFARLQGVARPLVAAEKFLKLLGLWEVRDDPAETFSKGMKQKLALARALLHDPDILFLDEPTSGLDPAMTKTVRDFLLELKSQGRTILLCTHNLHEAQRLCDRVAVIQNRILALDTPAALSRKLFRPKVEVRLRKMEKKFFVALSGLEGVVELEETGDGLRAGVSDPDRTTPRIVSTLVEAGAEILSVQSVEASLEEVYLKVTGHAASEAPAP